MKTITDTIFFQGRDIVVNVEYEMVDNGIGHYEFWGSVGNHRQIEPEILDITTDDAPLSTLILMDFDMVASVITDQLELE